MDVQAETIPCPRKRKRLASDDFLSGSGEREVSETQTQAFLLVEADNNSVSDETMAVLKAYDLHAKKSHVLTALTAEMITSGQCIVLLRDELYIFIKGGKLFCLKNVELWTEMCPTSDFHDVPAVEMDGYLVVLGSETEEHGSCERYDPAVNEWSKIGSTVRKSDFCCTVALEGWIYAIGYKKGTETKGSVAKYNPVNNVWRDVASPNLVTSSNVAAALNGEIYVAGKDKESNNTYVVEVYNPSQNVWRLAVFSTHQYDYLGLFTMNETLIAIRRKSSYPPCSKGIEIAALDFQYKKWVLTDKLENSTLDPHPTLYCTMKLVGTYFVIVKAGKERFICCLAKLMERSHYFRAMFNQDFQEKVTRKVDFLDVDPGAVKLCIRHITDEYFPDEIDVTENAESLFHVARMLLLDELIGYLSDYCGEKICLENFQALRSISYKYDLMLLEAACDRFAVKHFKTMIEQEFFLSLELDYLEYLLRSSKEEADLSETDKLKGILTWINCDEYARKEHFSELLAHVDVPKIELDTLKDAIKESVIYDDSKIRRRFQNAIKKRSRYHQVILQRNLDQGRRRHSFYAYLGKGSKWMPTKLPAQTSNTVLHCFAIQNDLYLIDQEKKLFSLKISELSAGWQEKAPLILTEENLAFVTTDSGMFYAFGKSEAAKYDVSTDSWSTVEFPETRTRFAAAVHKESIYILGGCEEQEGEAEDSALSTVARYDTVSEKWFNDVTPMPTARHSLTAVGCSGKIFVIGGIEGSNICLTEEYDPILNMWSLCRSSFERINRCKTLAANEQIYLLGSAYRGFSRVMQIFDPNNCTLEKKHIRQPLERDTSVCLSIPYDLIDE